MEYSKSVGVQVTEDIDMKYVDRGNKAPPPDFLPEDFIADGGWHDLDLSAIVPAAGANHLVYIKARGNSSNPGPQPYFNFRQAGNTQDINTAEAWSEVAGKSRDTSTWVMMSVDRKIQYRTFAYVTEQTITVRGYWTD